MEDVPYALQVSRWGDSAVGAFNPCMLCCPKRHPVLSSYILSLAFKLNAVSTKHAASPILHIYTTLAFLLQDTSFARMNLFSKAIKGQGFSTFLLQSLTDLKKLFRKETCNRKAY